MLIICLTASSSSDPFLAIIPVTNGLILLVELSISRLQKLVGKNTNKKQILDNLPFLGLDIESLGRNTVRVEYSPNRPDYSTDFGIALGLQGILGINKGMLRLNVRNQGNYEIRVDSSTSKIRPFVTGIIARNGSLDDEAVKQIINLSLIHI